MQSRLQVSSISVDTSKSFKRRWTAFHPRRTRIRKTYSVQDRRRYWAQVTLQQRNFPQSKALTDLGGDGVTLAEPSSDQQHESMFSDSALFDMVAAFPQSLEQEKTGEVVEDVRWYTMRITDRVKAGTMDIAEDIFLEMSANGVKGNVITYTAMMRGYYLQRKVKRVFKWYERMKRDDVEPNLTTLGTLISTCALNGNYSLSIKVLTEFRNMGMEPVIITMNALIQLCVNAKNLVTAKKLFDHIDNLGLERTIVTYNTMLDGYASLGTLYNRSEVLYQCKALKTRLEKDGFECDLQTYNIMIKLCFKMKAVSKALELFSEMKKVGKIPDVFTYGILIDGYVKHGEFENGKALIGACLSLFVELKMFGVTPNAYIYNSLMNVFVKTGRHFQAVKVFEEMKRKNVELDIVSYGTIIDSYVKHGYSLNKGRYLQGCLKYVDEMATRGLKPNCRIFSCLINACAIAGDKVLAEKFLQDMSSQGIEFNLIVFVTMIKVCLSVGCYEEALEWLHEIEKSKFESNAYPYNLIITWLVKRSRRVEARELISRLKSKGIDPDEVTREYMWRLDREMR